MQIEYARHAVALAEVQGAVEIFDPADERLVRFDQPVAKGDAHGIDAVGGQPFEILIGDVSIAVAAHVGLGFFAQGGRA